MSRANFSQNSNNFPRTLIGLIISTVAIAGCGGKEEMQTPPPAPQAPLSQSVEVITDTTDLCDGKLAACSTLVGRSIDACNRRSDLAAISACVNESVDCVNNAFAQENACRDEEELCREQGDPAIRVCQRECRDDYTRAQTACTSSQSVALADCNRRLNAANEQCGDRAKAAYDMCIDPAERGRLRCEGNVRVAFLRCLNGLEAVERNCATECQTEECRNGCPQMREQARIRCETDQQIDFNACQDTFRMAETACRIQERTVRDTCDAAIPGELRSCADQAFLAADLCRQRAGDVHEDCNRACDPLGAMRRCDRGCDDDLWRLYGDCFRNDWSCYTRLSNEGSLMCDAEGQRKVDACFSEAEMCKEVAEASK